MAEAPSVWRWSWYCGISGPYKVLTLTLLLSTAASVLLICAWSTNYWGVTKHPRSNLQIKGEAIQGALGKPVGGVVQTNYGLFFGMTYVWTQYNNYSRHLTMTCAIMENICAPICQNSYFAREDELIRLLEGRHVSRSCDSQKVRGTSDLVRGSIEDRRVKFIKPAYWISTLFFMTTATVSNVATTISLILNLTLRPPLHFFFSIPVMIIWNIFCILSSLMCVILWGVQIYMLDENLSIQETIRVDNTYDFKLVIEAGGSFYCVVAAFFLHFVNINLLNYDAAKYQAREGRGVPVIQ